LHDGCRSTGTSGGWDCSEQVDGIVLHFDEEDLGVGLAEDSEFVGEIIDGELHLAVLNRLELNNLRVLKETHFLFLTFEQI
jgi:hypothetical protein